MLLRHDTITLRPGVTEADFEQFMINDLIPFFSKAYQGPTRSSKADIKGQSLLKATERPTNTCGSRHGMETRGSWRVQTLKMHA